MTQAQFAANPEIFCKAVLAIAPDDRDSFWADLKASGAFTQSEVEAMQELVGLYQMHTDLRYSKMMQQACYELYCAAI